MQMFEDVIITDIVSVRLTDEKKYERGFVEYSPNLISNELIYRPSGHSTVEFDGQTIKTTPNSVHFLPHKQGGRYTVHYDKPDFFIDIFFLSDRPVLTAPFVINNIKSQKIAALFKKAFSCFVKKEEGYKAECFSILYKIFAELEKTSYLPESKFKKIEPAVKYIESNFLNSNISCTELARLCGISYNYLQRLFTEKYGLPPKKYVIQLKINYACNLLTTTDLSVTEVAEEVGFNDIYFFSRQFKEYIGMSPKEYKNKGVPN